MNWRHRARCRDVDPELFFPTGSAGPYEHQVEQAKAICGLCPVRDECLQWALDTAQDAGVWGGLSEEERRVIRRGRGRPLKHGLAYRYDQGCRCKSCTTAKTAAVRKYQQRKARTA